MNRRLLALLVTAWGTAPVAAADNVIAVIDGCIHRLDPSVDVGYAHITERCPDLAGSLASSPYAAWLPPDWNKPNNELSVGGLVEFRRLLTRSEPSPAVRAPRLARLSGVLSELHRHDSGQRSGWSRFKQWLREIFTPQPDSEDQGWLERLVGGLDLSQTVRRAIVWGTLFLLLLLVGAVVVNEVRHSAWWRRGRGRHRPGSGEVGQSGPGLDDVERAAANERPHLLLQLITRRLTEQQRLPPSRALTLNELERAARLSSERDRERLAVLTAACERARFAGQLSEPMLVAALVRGRELLASLETLPAQAAGAS